MPNPVSSFGTGNKFSIGLPIEIKYEVKQGPRPGDYDIPLNQTVDLVNRGPYVAADNDFEGCNSFLRAS